MGHPKAACTVKLPADNDKSNEKGSEKPARSSESRSKGSTLSLDMRDMFGAMNKSIKTFGKAMSQVSEEFEHLADNTSIGAQSHAQVGRIGLEDRGYAFAARLSSLRGHILLDNQSSVHVFCDPNLVLSKIIRIPQ